MSYDEVKALSDQIQAICEQFLLQPAHKSPKHLFLVANLLMRHAEIVFASLEHTYGFLPEAVEDARRRVRSEARRTFALANWLVEEDK